MKISHLFFALTALFVIPSCSTTKDAVSSKGDTTALDRAAIFENDQSKSLDPDESSPYVSEKYNGSFKRDIDLIHTKLEVSFDWDNSYVLGQATLTLKPWFYPIDHVVLDAKGFDIHEVSMYVDGQKKNLEYNYDELKLDIELTREFSRNEEFNLFISYTGKPDELEAGGSAAITSDKGLYFINPKGEDPDKPTQLWTQGETEANSCWFPTVDKPNEKTTQEIYITVDNKYRTLSNGELKRSVDNNDGTRTDHWAMYKPHAPYLFMMAVGDFAVVNDYWNGITVDYWVAPEYGKYAQQIFGNTPEMLQFYSDLLGVKYPWPKYSQVVVEDFVSGAMENTSATIHFGGLHKTTRELLDETHEDIIAHEVFHQWFGDLVTCESWANLPLNESFATYGEYLWMEYKYGREEADKHLEADLRNYLAEASQKQVDLIRFDYGEKDQMFDGHSYQKGGRVLHMLRKYTGDEAFFAALKKYLEVHEYTDVEIHELRIAFEDVTGEDLNWFFNQWFFNSGHPTIEIDYNKSEATGKWDVTIRQTQKRDETPVYILPIDIDIYENGKVVREKVQLEKREQTFELNASNPEWINVDAEKMLLGKVTYNMPDEWYSYQLENGPLYIDRIEALTWFAKNQDSNPTAVEWLGKAMDDRFWGVQVRAVSNLDTDVEVPIEIRDRVEDLAKNHAKSDVRAMAIRKLGQFEGEDYSEIFMNALESDSSWMVAANGLRQLGNTDAKEALDLAEQFKDSDNTNMMMVVLSLYAEHGGADDHSFFKEKLAATGGFQRYFVMQEYGDYLNRQQDMLVVLEGANTIAESAIDSEIWWMPRVAQSVVGDLKSATEKRKEDLEESDVDFSSKVEVINEQLVIFSEILDRLAEGPEIEIISDDGE